MRITRFQGQRFAPVACGGLCLIGEIFWGEIREFDVCQMKGDIEGGCVPVDRIESELGAPENQVWNICFRDHFSRVVRLPTCQKLLGIGRRMDRSIFCRIALHEMSGSVDRRCRQAVTVNPPEIMGRLAQRHRDHLGNVQVKIDTRLPLRLICIGLDGHPNFKPGNLQLKWLHPPLGCRK